MLPTEMANTTPVKSTSCTTGTGALAVGSVVLRGSIMLANNTNDSVTGISTQKAARQASYSANTPPTAGPIKVAAPHIPEISAIARGHRAWSNTRRIIE